MSPYTVKTNQTANFDLSLCRDIFQFERNIPFFTHPISVNSSCSDRSKNRRLCNRSACFIKRAFLNKDSFFTEKGLKRKELIRRSCVAIGDAQFSMNTFNFRVSAFLVMSIVKSFVITTHKCVIARKHHSLIVQPAV